MRSRHAAAEARLQALVERHIHLMCTPSASVRSRLFLRDEVRTQQRIVDQRWRDLRRAEVGHV